MMKLKGTALIKGIFEPGVIFHSSAIEDDIVEYDEFRAAIVKELKGYLSVASPYSLAVIVGDHAMYLAIIKRKLGLSGGGVAVASYGVCRLNLLEFYDDELLNDNGEKTVIVKSEAFQKLILSLYTSCENKTDIIGLIKKYNNIAGQTFYTEGNALYSDDAEKMSVCIFAESDDPITEQIVGVSEDDMIVHDLYAAGNGVLRDISGAHLRYITERGRSLDIINVNRKNIETALGVDMIYFMREFRCAVMVQYKRISSGVYYTSQDGNYKKEISRMIATQKYFNIPTAGDDNFEHKLFRLNGCPYYFKLCPEASATTNRFVSGACINLHHWIALMKSDRCKTRDGNGKIGYGELDGRHLTSMEFIRLMKRGLVGGYLHDLNALRKLIEGLANQHHMIVGAIESPGIGYVDR